MQHVKKMIDHAKGLQALPLAAAFLLFVTPLFGLAYDAAVASAIIIGGVALMLWAKLALSPDGIDYWLMAVVGAMALFAPWILGFGSFASWAFLAHLLAGLAILGVAGYDLIKLREAQKASRVQSG
jgi:hypothetical protein